MQEIRLTPTSYIVLGLLELAGESTPYGLKQLVAASVGHFWTLQHAQLYTETERLAAAGYVTERRESGGRRRKLYALTDRGREALVAWRDDPASERAELREPSLLKLFFGADAAPPGRGAAARPPRRSSPSTRPSATACRTRSPTARARRSTWESATSASSCASGRGSRARVPGDGHRRRAPSCRAAAARRPEGRQGHGCTRCSPRRRRGRLAGSCARRAAWRRLKGFGFRRPAGHVAHRSGRRVPDRAPGRRPRPRRHGLPRLGGGQPALEPRAHDLLRLQGHRHARRAVGGGPAARQGDRGIRRPGRDHDPPPPRSRERDRRLPGRDVPGLEGRVGGGGRRRRPGRLRQVAVRPRLRLPAARLRLERGQLVLGLRPLARRVRRRQRAGGVHAGAYARAISRSCSGRRAARCSWPATRSSCTGRSTRTASRSWCPTSTCSGARCARSGSTARRLPTR